jgi:hypothetical protein
VWEASDFNVALTGGWAAIDALALPDWPRAGYVPCLCSDTFEASPLYVCSKPVQLGVRLRCAHAFPSFRAHSGSMNGMLRHCQYSCLQYIISFTCVVPHTCAQRRGSTELTRAPYEGGAERRAQGGFAGVRCVGVRAC